MPLPARACLFALLTANAIALPYPTVHPETPLSPSHPPGSPIPSLSSSATSLASSSDSESESTPESPHSISRPSTSSLATSAPSPTPKTPQTPNNKSHLCISNPNTRQNNAPRPLQKRSTILSPSSLKTLRSKVSSPSLNSSPYIHQHSAVFLLPPYSTTAPSPDPDPSYWPYNHHPTPNSAKSFESDYHSTYSTPSLASSSSSTSSLKSSSSLRSIHPTRSPPSIPRARSTRTAGLNLEKPLPPLPSIGLGIQAVKEDEVEGIWLGQIEEAHVREWMRAFSEDVGRVIGVEERIGERGALRLFG